MQELHEPATESAVISLSPLPTDASGDVDSISLTSSSVSGPRGTTRDPKVTFACTECKRRKTKCDGKSPCYSCNWYKHPGRCVYVGRQIEPRVTRKTLGKLQAQLEGVTGILRRLFPTYTVESLLPLPREGLLEALLSAPDVVKQIQNSHEAAQGMETDSSSSLPSESHERLTQAEYVISDEDDHVAIADDVNAISLDSDHASSYLGPASAMASFRLLLRIAPQSLFSQQEAMKQIGSSAQASTERFGRPILPTTARDPSSLIDSYFKHVHSTTPIIDEAEFRNTFTSGKRRDDSWLGLLNMVFALGVIGVSEAGSSEDIAYFKVAKSHVKLESFGSGRIETVQSLILMAGWYLHYRNRPNMASAIMGALRRMAYAFGLHKETAHTHTIQNEGHKELRRRIWWSLVVLDAGEATTLGRVFNTEVVDSDTKIPLNIDDTTGIITKEPTKCSILIATVKLAQLLGGIHERLNSSLPLGFADLLGLDATLVYWHDGLPHYLRGRTECPDWLTQPRETLQWRYLNLRILLFKPTLMHAVLHPTEVDNLTQDQRVSISKCQSLARESIERIGSTWTQNQYSGWPAVWYLFQACIIPLLSLYTFRKDLEMVDEWDQQVQTSLEMLKTMEPFGVAAQSMHKVIYILYNARTESLTTTLSHDSPILYLRGDGTAGDATAMQQHPSNWFYDSMSSWENLPIFSDQLFGDIEIEHML